MDDAPPQYDSQPLTAEEAEALQAIPVCAHCGGRHARACPRVRRIEYHPNGALSAVEFWPSGRWPADHIIWPEDIEDAATGTTQQP